MPTWTHKALSVLAFVLPYDLCLHEAFSCKPPSLGVQVAAPRASRGLGAT